VVPAAVTVALVVTACARTSSTGADVRQGAAAPAAPAGGAAAGQAPTPAGQPASFRADALDAPPAPSGVSFISTATVTIEVDDVAATKPRVVAVAQAAGGALFGEDTSYGARSRSVITLKVPPAAFAQVLSDLAGLGTLASQQVKTDDVTQQVIDLDARIAASSASLDRTRDLLGQAKSLNDVAYLEGEVSRRQADLESLRGQQRTLRGRIDLATVVVTLAGTDDATPAERERRREAAEPAGLPGFTDGLRGGWEVLVKVATVSAAVLGAVLPFLPLVALVLVGLRLWRRRRRARAAAAAPSAPSAPPPPPAAPVAATP
jgi:hypothetical protein